MIDAEKKIVKSINCKCGNNHQTAIDKIIIEQDATTRIVEILKDILSCGHIALTSYDDIEIYSDIRHSLRKAGYKITEIIYPAFTRANLANAGRLLDLEDSVRLIIGVGSGSLNDMVKYASMQKGIPNVFLITAPSTDSWLNNEVSLDDSTGLHIEKGIVPSYLIIDTSIKCPRALIASGLSSLYARLLGIFDYKYQSLITGNKICSVIIEEMKNNIKYFYKEPFDYEDSGDIRRLMVCLLDVALKMSYLEDTPIMAEDTIARLIRIKTNNSPSSSLIAANTLNNIYSYWLRNKCKDTKIPPERALYYDNLQRKFALDYYDLLLNHKDYDSDTYSRVSYITENMREELLGELDSLIPNSSIYAKLIMMVFIDKGYHMSELIDYRELMFYVTLSAEISAPLSLLKFIDKTGLLCNYINCYPEKINTSCE